jgi:hypothetical protein
MLTAGVKSLSAGKPTKTPVILTIGASKISNERNSVLTTSTEISVRIVFCDLRFTDWFVS